MVQGRNTIGGDSAGNVLIAFAILLPLVVGALGAGFDYSRAASLRGALQDAADAAALAGARQFIIANGDKMVPANVARHIAQSGAEAAGAHDAIFEISADEKDPSVSVDIAYQFTPTFLTAIYKSPIRVEVRAAAVVSGTANVCVIGLSPTGDDIVLATDHANLSAPDCAVYANSQGPKAMGATKAAMLVSKLACVAGGYYGPSSNYAPQPTTDCPERADPLAGRAEPPAPGVCDYTNRILDGFTGSIDPGVYCAGLTLRNGSNVTFNPGIYYIKNGMLKIGDATARGANVGFFFTGADAVAELTNPADVEFEGPLVGAMAGILFWRDADATGAKVFKITSPNVMKLTGAVYLPKGEFDGAIIGGGNIANASAYTAIIAERVTLEKKSNLVLNTDYGATQVPVPGGLRGEGGTIRLRN